jgi:hypothetical protein
MKKLLTVLIVASHFLACNNPSNERLPTIQEVRGDTISHIDSTKLQEEEVAKTSDEVKRATTPSLGPFRNEVFTSGYQETTLTDALAGNGPRYTFACIMYRMDGDTKDRMWLSDIVELESFSEDAQAMFLDRCIKDVIHDNYNRPINVVARTAFMAYRYALVSKKRIDIQSY